MAERNRLAERADRRDRVRFWARTLLVCFCWAALGLYLGAWAFHVTDPELGRILLTIGQLVTWIGVLGTVARALYVSADRGWR